MQKRLYRSLKIWMMYCDLEESLGTPEATCRAYDSILHLRIATPQIILNYAAYLEVPPFLPPFVLVTCLSPFLLPFLLSWPRLRGISGVEMRGGGRIRRPLLPPLHIKVWSK